MHVVIRGLTKQRIRLKRFSRERGRGGHVIKRMSSNEEEKKQTIVKLMQTAVPLTPITYGEAFQSGNEAGLVCCGFI